MSRVYIDCRDVPSETGCSIALAADGADELLEAAVQHAVSVHGHSDDDTLRSALRDGIHEGAAPGTPA